MHFTFLPLVLFTLASAAPAPNPVDPTIEVRQIGGGPNDASFGYGWTTRWRDTTLKEPQNFRSVRRGGCSYDITFRRDARDSPERYNLNVIAVYDSGET